jgi:hypothetical protein
MPAGYELTLISFDRVDGAASAGAGRWCAKSTTSVRTFPRLAFAHSFLFARMIWRTAGITNAGFARMLESDSSIAKPRPEWSTNETDSTVVENSAFEMAAAARDTKRMGERRLALSEGWPCAGTGKRPTL